MIMITDAQQKILLHAFQELDKSSPVFPSPEEAVLNTILMLSTPSLHAASKVHYGTRAEREDLLVRLIAYRYYSIAEILSARKEADYILFRSFFTQISNTTMAIIHLAEGGFDYQAISLIRNIVELFMMIIVIADSSTIRQKALDVKSASGANALWKRHFSKSRFIEMVSRYSETFKYLVDSVEEWTKQVYKDLSSFAHNDYANVLAYSVAAADEKGTAAHNFYGKYVTHEAEVSTRLALAIAPLDLILCSILQDSTKDITLSHLYDIKKDYDSMMNYFNANTLRKICMLLYSDITKNTTVKERVPVPLCTIRRSSVDRTKPFFANRTKL